MRHGTSIDLAQRRLSDDVRYRQALERGGRNSGNKDDRSSGSCVSTDENVLPEREAVWNSRPGCRPRFSFSDPGTAGGDNKRWVINDTARRKSMSASSSSLLMSSVQQSTPRRTMRSRASQIPLTANRPHQKTSRRHSADTKIDSTTTAAILDLSRDHEND